MTQRFRGKHDRRSAVDILNDVALAASSGELAAIRDLIDEIVDSSPIGTIGRTVRDRLVRAQITFQQGAGGGIGLEPAVTAINTAFAALDAPAFCQTTHAQVQLFREFMHLMVPALIRAVPAVGPGRPLSPAEWTHVTLHLAQQKLINPSFEVGADEWVKQVEDRKAGRAPMLTGPKEPTLVTLVRDGPPWSDGIVTALERGARDENGPVVATVHGWLDTVGMVR